MTFNSLQFPNHKTGCEDETQPLACDSPEKFPMQIGCGIVQFCVCNAKHCIYHRSSKAGFPLNPVLHTWSRQMTLLCLCVNERDILRQGESPDTAFDSLSWGKGIRGKDLKKPMHVSQALQTTELCFLTNSHLIRSNTI